MRRHIGSKTERDATLDGYLPTLDGYLPLTALPIWLVFPLGNGVTSICAHPTFAVLADGLPWPLDGTPTPHRAAKSLDGGFPVIPSSDPKGIRFGRPGKDFVINGITVRETAVRAQIAPNSQINSQLTGNLTRGDRFAQTGSATMAPAERVARVAGGHASTQSAFRVFPRAAPFRRAQPGDFEK